MINIANGLFNKSLSSGKESSVETQVDIKAASLEQSTAVSSISDLTKGQVFEAVVKDVKNNQIFLSLANGQVLSARLESSASFNIGESVSFVVKSNNGEQISIIPMPQTNYNNPTLLKALSAASLEITSDNLEMVKSMMEEQMAVNKQSLQNMHKILLNYPDSDVKSLVQMIKLNIPITENNLYQFQNYRNYENQITKDIDNISNKLPQTLEEMSIIKDVILNTEQGNLMPEEADSKSHVFINKSIQAIVEMTGNIREGLPNEITQGLTEENFVKLVDNIDALNARQLVEYIDSCDNERFQTLLLNINSFSSEQTDNIIRLFNGLNENQMSELVNIIDGMDNNQAADFLSFLSELNPQSQQEFLQSLESGENLKSINLNAQLINIATEKGTEFADINTVLNTEEKSELVKKLSDAGMPPELVERVKAGDIKENDLLNLIKENLGGNDTSSKSVFNQLQGEVLFSCKAYHKLLSDSMTRQWTLTPEEVADGEKLDSLYEKINRHFEQIIQNSLNMGKSGAEIGQSATSARSNLEFMNQVNQLYTYVQLPLKMSGQKAHSDLYVFTNKKNLKDEDGEITALLHLEMEQLGEVDVYLKMLHKSLNTKFTLSDYDSLQLLRKNIVSLITRLERKGYVCNVEFEENDNKVNFVEDFLKQGQAVGTPLQRYSFDVRA